MAKDIPQGEVEILPGYVGNLDDEQRSKLKEIWNQFFETLEKYDKEGDEVAEGAGDADKADETNDPKKSGIPTDDKAKDEAKKAQERKDMQEMLDKYGSRKLREAFWQFNKGDNPDTSMLRFLRARKWDVDRALSMLATCMKWRIENKVEEMVNKGELGNDEIPHFLEQNRSGKTYGQGTSGNEQPICYIHVKKHRTFGQPSSSMSKYVIFSMESFRLLMVPPNDKIILLFDMTDFGLASMDWNCILFIVKCLEAYYPESLGTLYIHKAPWIFNAIWRILGPLLDPVVRSKVKFTYQPEDLKERIPSERLIKDLGGEQEFYWHFDEPKEGENDLVKDKEARAKVWKEYLDIATQFEHVTRKSSLGDDDPTAKERDVLIKKLRIKNFELEKHIRGLTVYHRKGIISGDGVITWNYPQTDGEVLRHSVGHRFSSPALQQQIDEGLTPDQWQEKYGAEFNERLRAKQAESGDDTAQDERLDVEKALGPAPSGKTGKLKMLASKITPGPSIAEQREQDKQRLIQEHEEKMEQKRREEKEQKDKQEQEKREQEEKENGNGATANGSSEGYVGAAKNTAWSLAGKAADYTPGFLGGNKLKSLTIDDDGEEANGQAA